MLDRFPFSYRVGLLLALTMAGALADLWRNGSNATRHKEYGFIWFTGIVGAIIGTVNDLITSSLSPEFFTLGKGLAGGDGLRAHAARFGLEHGLSAGVIAGAICLYAARRKSAAPPLPYARVLALLWMPVAGAMAGAILVPVAAGSYDPAGLAVRLDGELTSAQMSAFLQVWWIHTGLYAGLLAGLVGQLFLVTRRRAAFSK